MFYRDRIGQQDVGFLLFIRALEEDLRKRRSLVRVPGLLRVCQEISLSGLRIVGVEVLLGQFRRQHVEDGDADDQH